MKKTILFLVGMLMVSQAHGRGEPALVNALRKDRGKEIMEAPVVFYADDIKYDHASGVWTATGRVEFAQGDAQGNRVLEADAVTFNERTNLLTARGHVRLREKDEEALYAEYVELTGDLKDGVLQQVRFLMADKSRLAAQSARRSDAGTKTIFTQAVYTPCYPCTEDTKRAPTWQINAREVVRDEAAKAMTATDVHMEFLQVPVFYVPYLRFPTERSSGFLTPVLVASTTLGTSFGVPYFWAINDASDMTLTPFAMTKQGGMLGGQYRHRWHQARLDVRGSFNGGGGENVVTEIGSIETVPNLRGHLVADGRFDLNSKWRILLDGKIVSDRTYFRSFRELPLFSHLWDAPFLQSTARGERFSQQDYLTVEGLYYQGLREGSSLRNAPIVAPNIAYHQTSLPLVGGSFFTVDTNLLALSRAEGDQYQRAIFQGEWNLPYTSPWGHVTRIFARLRGDLYHTRVMDVNPPTLLFSGGVTRFLPQIGAECRWPLYNQFALVEPAVQIIGAPTLTSSHTIPNEDCEGFEFNDANLFQRDRFPGLDRIDDGSRATYGFFLVPTGAMLRSTRFFLGQSFAFSRVQPDLTGTGIYRRFSDFVGNLQADPHPWVSLDGRVRLSRDKLRVLFSEVTAGVGPEISRIDLSYVYFPSAAIAGQQLNTEQLGMALTSRLNSSWTVKFAQLRGLREAGLLSQGIRIIYHNECLDVQTSLERSYYRDKDIRPGTTFLITIAFKNLGSTGYGTSSRSHGQYSSGGAPLFVK